MFNIDFWMPKAITGHKKSFSVYNWISKEFNIHSLELGKSKKQLNCIVTSQDPDGRASFLTTIISTLLFNVKQTKIIVSQQLNKTVLMMNFLFYHYIHVCVKQILFIFRHIPFKLWAHISCLVEIWRKNCVHAFHNNMSLRLHNEHRVSR